MLTPSSQRRMRRIMGEEWTRRTQRRLEKSSVRLLDFKLRNAMEKVNVRTVCGIAETNVDALLRLVGMVDDSWSPQCVGALRDARDQIVTAYLRWKRFLVKQGVESLPQFLALFRKGQTLARDVMLLVSI